jgi:hypothetical protein
MNATVQQHMEKLGFALTETGGGCTAWEKQVACGTVLVTSVDDPIAPDSMDAPVYVTIFAANTHDAIASVHVNHLREVADVCAY